MLRLSEKIEKVLTVYNWSNRGIPFQLFFNLSENQLAARAFKRRRSTNDFVGPLGKPTTIKNTANRNDWRRVGHRAALPAGARL